jgi:hypothetical protein
MSNADQKPPRCAICHLPIAPTRGEDVIPEMPGCTVYFHEPTDCITALSARVKVLEEERDAERIERLRFGARLEKIGVAIQTAKLAERQLAADRVEQAEHPYSDRNARNAIKLIEMAYRYLYP